MNTLRTKSVLLLLVTFSLLLTSTSFACSLCGSNEAKSNAIGLEVVRNAVKENPATVLAFHSSSCGTCKVQKPRLQSLLLKNQNSNLKGIFLDFDAEEEIKKKFKVNYPSTVLVFKNGTEVARVTGETDEAALQDLLSKGVL